MFKFIILAIFVGIIGFSVWNFSKVSKSLEKDEKPVLSPQVTPQVVTEVQPVRTFPFVKTDTKLPVLSTEEESFKPGVAASNGVVQAVQDGVVKVQSGNTHEYIRTSATVPTREVQFASGRVYDSEGKLERVLLGDGRILRVGKRFDCGELLVLSEESAKFKRIDGGEHYVLFGFSEPPRVTEPKVELPELGQNK